MPIYEYACKNCDHTLDALQKLSDQPLLNCPECGKPQLRRLLSAPRFRLKGQGWYETDFKKDKQRNVLKSDGDSQKADSTADAKTDSKPETKPESKPESRTAPKPAPKSEAGSGS
ncbi:MAG: zinc ribbon domain-containing protein [Gammaproteobacteria bacterium]|nr:zinc ribbon domain-containing protein [Gammaproteobacteria bacterium]MDH5344794.1 zinc ribbon domain-containing protein [Gammaproteobacteria bacterium]